MGGSTPGKPVGGNTAVIAVTPAVTAGAYVAGKAIGGLLTFAAAAIAGANSGVVVGLTVLDKAKQDVALDLWLFSSAPTAPGDLATFAASAADLAKLVGVVKVAASDYSDASANSAASIHNVGIAFDLGEGNTSLFGLLVARGGATYASTSDLTVKLHVLQD